jgi:hypothetical protein
VNAYDYDKQQWVEGSEAVAVRIKQVEEQLAALNGPRAKEFVKFACNDYTVCGAIERCRGELAELKGQVNL